MSTQESKPETQRSEVPVRIPATGDPIAKFVQVRLEELLGDEDESIVRIDNETMKTLEVSAGDKIVIIPPGRFKGVANSTVRTVTAALPEDEGKGIARVGSKTLNKMKTEPKAEALLGNLLYKIVVRLKSTKGFCDFGHRPGDVYVYYPPPVSKSRGILCPGALFTVWPQIMRVRGGAESVTTICVDYINQSLFEIRRERTEPGEISKILASDRRSEV